MSSTFKVRKPALHLRQYLPSWVEISSPLPCQIVHYSVPTHNTMTYLPAAPWWNMLRRIKEPRELVDQCPHIAGKKMSPPLVKECVQGHTPSYAAAAKSLQSCPTLCNPIDGSPPGSPVPGILQARTLEWVAISFSNARKWKVKVKSLSCIWLFATPWTVAYQAPLSLGFSRQEYWSGVPLPSLTPSYSSLQIGF